MEDIETHQTVFIETGLSHKNNITLSDWMASGVDDIFIYESSKMVLVIFNNGNHLWLAQKEY